MIHFQLNCKWSRDIVIFLVMIEFLMMRRTKILFVFHYTAVVTCGELLFCLIWNPNEQCCYCDEKNVYKWYREGNICTTRIFNLILFLKDFDEYVGFVHKLLITILASKAIKYWGWKSWIINSDNLTALGIIHNESWTKNCIFDPSSKFERFLWTYSHSSFRLYNFHFLNLQKEENFPPWIFKNRYKSPLKMTFCVHTNK